MSQSFDRLVEIMAVLRGPDGCPWDRKQTHESLKPYLLEEAYEVLEVMGDTNDNAFCEELGDLLLQIVFHARLAEEEKRFAIGDVIRSINEKLIRRHPHVFGDKKIETAEEQTIHWEKVKKTEGKKSVVDGVPKALPSLVRSQRVQQKAATVGFDWDHKDQVWAKVREETAELEEAVAGGDPSAMEEEMGDLLFAVVNYARFIHVNPEEALRKATDKFIRRFKKVESALKASGREMHDSTLGEMDSVWNDIKHE